MVTTPAGHRRGYSLVDSGSADVPQQYVVCVRRDSGGRGGSVSMHDDVAVGTALVVSAPVNRFPLEPSPRYDENGRLDLWPYLAVPDDDVRVYCCGPAALVRAVRTLTAHWRMSRKGACVERGRLCVAGQVSRDRRRA